MTCATKKKKKGKKFIVGKLCGRIGVRKKRGDLIGNCTLEKELERGKDTWGCMGMNKGQ